MSTLTQLRFLTDRAFTQLGDVLPTASFTRRTSGTYNPATGTVSPASSVNYPVKSIVSQYQRAEIDGVVVRQTDRRLSLRQTELPVTPQLQDQVTVQGRTWQIMDIQQDAASLLWILHLRGEG